MLDMKDSDQTNHEIRLVSGEVYDIPIEGSLGLLALGYKGLLAWRHKRKRSNCNETIIKDNVNSNDSE